MTMSKKTPAQQFERSQTRRDNFFNNYTNGQKSEAAKCVKKLTKYEAFQLAMDVAVRYEPNTLDSSACYSFIQDVLAGKIFY